jgi:hypothetical protein
MNSLVKNTGRRAFLKSALRTLILGALMVLCGIFGRKKNLSGSVKKLCETDTPCSTCPEFYHCGYPKATESKKDTYFR